MSYEKPQRFRDQLESDKQKSLFFFSVIAFGFAFAILSMLAGFMYGDYYGRQHAQFDNPKLREHYSQQCFKYIDKDLKKTMKDGLAKFGPAEQNQKLEEIRSVLSSIRIEMNNNAAPSKSPSKDSKKKVAAAR